MYAESLTGLSSVKGRPVFQKRDMSGAPMANFLEVLADFDKKNKQASIQEETALFYLSNHGFHAIETKAQNGGALSPGQLRLASEHATRVTQMSLRMLCYLMVISAEEMGFGEPRNDRLYDFVESTTSADAAKWLKSVMERGGGRSGPLGSKASVGKATLGECAKALEMGFRFARWSPGFGGLPWAQIAATAGEAIRGDTSLELMIDHAFTLCHNNGAIFNKGHQYSHYPSDYYHLLDIQASGQMPAAIEAGQRVSGLQSASVKALHEQFKKELGDLKGYMESAYDASLVKSKEAARKKKEAAAAKAAAAFLSAGGGWGAAGAQQPSGPPPRACDNLFTIDDFNNVHGIQGGVSKPWSPF